MINLVMSHCKLIASTSHCDNDKKQHEEHPQNSLLSKCSYNPRRPPPAECFTEDAAANCRNQSLLYYNKSCISIDSYCSIGNLSSYNETYCEDLITGEIKKAEGSVPRISASEDYFK